MQSATARLPFLLKFSANSLSCAEEIAKTSSSLVFSTRRVTETVRISVFPQSEDFSWKACSFPKEACLLEAVPDSLITSLKEHLKDINRSFRVIATANTYFYPGKSPREDWQYDGCSSLLPSDADFVNRSWKFGTASSLSIFQEAIANRPSSCIRDKSGNVLSWAVQRHDGSIGNVQTLEPHRGKGFAKRVVNDLTIQILDTQTPFCHIEPANSKSIRMFRDLGWQIVDDELVHWIKISTAPKPKL